jgi:phosphatidylinositol alpha-1,6-mannosyltransferase
MTATSPSGVIVLTCEYPPFPGGIGTYAGQLVEAVRNEGFQATVIAPAYPDLPAIEAEHDTHRVLGHHRIGPKSVLRILSILRRTPRDWPFLAADIRTVLITWLTSPLHRRPYRAMIHGSEVSKFKAGSPLFLLVRQAYRSAEMICANSQATLDIFSENFGAPAHSAVTYLAADSWWSEPATGEFEHEALRAIPADSGVICAVGRIEPRKGQLETVQAVALARDTHGLDSPVLVIAGRPEDEAYAAEVQAEAERSKLSVVLTGRTSNEDLRRLYHRSLCHTLFARALPGKIEGFGLVLLEAACQTCPSVATRVGGIPEVMGDTGKLIPPEDIDAFAQAIARYATDDGERQAEGRTAQEHAKGFTWRRCAAGTFPELVWP